MAIDTRPAELAVPGVHESGRREVIGLDVGEAETEAFWREFLRDLVARGLIGVELCVSDAHPGLKAAIAQVLGCAWQRCTVHFLRDLLGHARKEQAPMLAALVRPIFQAEGREPARELLSAAVEALERRLPKVAAMLEAAEEDVLAFLAFPPGHRRQLRSTDESVKGSGTIFARSRPCNRSRWARAGPQIASCGLRAPTSPPPWTRGTSAATANGWHRRVRRVGRARGLPGRVSGGGAERGSEAFVADGGRRAR